MTGHRPFRELTEHLPRERRDRIEKLSQQLAAEMPLHELRRARSLTQQDVAEALEVKQPAVAKLERRADIYVSSLRSYIEAVGGRLRIVAEFPDGDVSITSFSELGEGERPRRS